MYDCVPSFRWKLKIGKKDVTDRLLRMHVIQKMPQDLLFTVSMPVYRLHIDLIDVKLGDISKGLSVHVLEDTTSSGDRFLLPPFYIDSISAFEGKLSIVCLPFFILRSFSKSIDSRGDFQVLYDIVPAIEYLYTYEYASLPTLEGFFSAISTPAPENDFPTFVTLYTRFDAVPPYPVVGSPFVFMMSYFDSPICLFNHDCLYSVKNSEPLPPVSTVLKPEISFLPKPVPLFEYTGLRGSFGHLWYILILGEDFLFLVRVSKTIFRAQFLVSRSSYVFSVPEDAEFSAFLGYSHILFSTPQRSIVIDCYSGEVVYEYAGSLLLSYAPSEVYVSDYLRGTKADLFALLSLSQPHRIVALRVMRSSVKTRFYTASLFAVEPGLSLAFNKGVIYFKGSYVRQYVDVEVYFVGDQNNFYVLCVNYQSNKYACVPLKFSARPLNVSLGIKGAFCMEGDSLGLVIHSDGCRYEVRDILRFNSSFTSMYAGNPTVKFEKGSAFYEPVRPPNTLPGVDTYMSVEEYSSPARFFYDNTFDKLKKGFVKDKRYYTSSDGHFYISSIVKYRSDLIIKFSSDSSAIKVYRPSTSKLDSVSWNYVPSVRLLDSGVNISVPNTYPLHVSVLPVFSSWTPKDIVAGQFLHRASDSSDWKVYNISPNRILPLGAPVKFIDTDGIEKEGRIVSSEYIYEGTEKIRIRVLH